ncbi:cold-shock protein [Paenibacillus sp. GCM10012307]|uniref:Cold-shock protein n=1 Tax=Paenibacillus roseus TaxID=2798579 RepID=A0A934MPK9_9BACL|nr:cold-shock protein [Paenibacillus roseus]
MYYSKKNVEPTPEEQTAIWTCSNDSCSCWMRNDFSFLEEPHCPICKSEMSQGTKLLPVLKS